MLRAVLQEGELERGEVPGMLNVTDRQSRKVTSRLLERDVLRSDSPRAPLRIHFPAEVA